MKVRVLFGNLAYGTPDMAAALADASEQNGIESVWGQVRVSGVLPSPVV